MKPSKHKKRVSKLKKEGKWVDKTINRKLKQKVDEKIEKIRIGIIKTLDKYIGCASADAENRIRHEVNDLLTRGWLRGDIGNSEVKEILFDDTTGRCEVVIGEKPEFNVEGFSRPNSYQNERMRRRGYRT
jgi:hypothetical protein